MLASIEIKVPPVPPLRVQSIHESDYLFHFLFPFRIGLSKLHVAERDASSMATSRTTSRSLVECHVCSVSYAASTRPVNQLTKPPIRLRFTGSLTNVSNPEHDGTANCTRTHAIENLPEASCSTMTESRGGGLLKSRAMQPMGAGVFNVAR